MRPEQQQELDAEKARLEANANKLRERLAHTLESLKQRQDSGDGAPAVVLAAVEALPSAQGVSLMSAQPEVLLPAYVPVQVPEEEPEKIEIEIDPEVEKTRLESGANRLRRRLGRTLEALKQRRKHAFDLKYQLKHHPLPLIVAGTGALFGVGAGVAAAVHRAHKHQAENRLDRLAERMTAVARVFRQPELAAKPAKSSTGKGVLLGVVFSLTTYAVTQLAKRALNKTALRFL